MPPELLASTITGTPHCIRPYITTFIITSIFTFRSPAFVNIPKSKVSVGFGWLSVSLKCSSHCVFCSSASRSVFQFLSLIRSLELLLASVSSLTMWCTVFILFCLAASWVYDAFLSSNSFLSAWQLHLILLSKIGYLAMACSHFFCVVACSHWLFNTFFHQSAPMFCPVSSILSESLLSTQSFLLHIPSLFAWTVSTALQYQWTVAFAGTCYWV